MTIEAKNIEAVIKDFKGEIKDNRAQMKECIREGDYSQAAHLNSVNGALDYVIMILNHELSICDYL